MFGVTKLAGLTRIRSWVSRSSSISLGPGTPITLMPTEHWPKSSRSGGAYGPGPEKRTQRDSPRLGEQAVPKVRREAVGSTVNSARSTPNVLVLPNRCAPPGSQFSLVNFAISSITSRGCSCSSPGSSCSSASRQMLVLRREFCSACAQANSGGLQPFVELRPVEELDPPLQPPEPEEQVAERPEDQEGEQPLGVRQGALLPCGLPRWQQRGNVLSRPRAPAARRLSLLSA